MYVFHELSEFANFPWELLTEDWFNLNYGVKYAVSNKEIYSHYGSIGPYIHIKNRHYPEEIWPIPKQLERLLITYRKHGRKQVQDEFQELMGMQSV